MIDHFILAVSNIERSLAFYSSALRPLDIGLFVHQSDRNDRPDLWGYGNGKKVSFWIKKGHPNPDSLNWGFEAESAEKVDEFYLAAIAAGAIHHSSSRESAEKSPTRYAVGVLDPDGYAFEVIYTPPSFF
jgi:catechol 2,3-dioxygenase-like lactoylglutathione lyase family enzyme